MELESIRITCKSSTEVDSTLLDILMKEFKVYDEANAVLTCDDFIKYFTKAYVFGYFKIIAEANMGILEPREKALKKLAPINLKTIECVVSNKAQAPILLQALLTMAEANLIEIAKMGPMRRMFDPTIEGLFFVWDMIAAKIEIETPTV